jgi:uncharacterized protein YciI
VALYAMIGFDRHPHRMALRDSIRTEHRAYVVSNIASIKLGGALVDDAGNQIGTLLIFDAASEQDVWNWIREEPFYRNGVFETVAVRQWNVVIGAIAPKA